MGLGDQVVQSPSSVFPRQVDVFAVDILHTSQEGRLTQSDLKQMWGPDFSPCPRADKLFIL